MASCRPRGRYDFDAATGALTNGTANPETGANFVWVAPGAGARHAVIAPLFVGGRVLHVLTEMGSTLETFAIDDTSGALGKRLDSISTLPPPPSRKTTHHDSGSDEATSLPDGGRLLRGRAAAAGAETTRTTKEEEGAVTEEDEATCQKAAEILLSADNRFVYASNRGASNSIAVYARDTDSGTLSIVEVRARRTNRRAHMPPH